jgi:hypothetical protein
MIAVLSVSTRVPAPLCVIAGIVPCGLIAR